MPPRQYGPYDLYQRISVGGMAEIFEALHRDSGRRVALKRILPSVVEDDEFIDLFQDEARIASRLHHPNIARILDLGQVNGSHYIALEFIHGRPLRSFVDRAVANREWIPLPVVVFIAQCVARALEHAHGQKDETGAPLNVVHRDVSPQNILISWIGEVKLIDFGIAKAAGRITRTAAGNIKGKVGYMSPEQVTGSNVDRQSDIFALGICLWEMLCLRQLFDAPNELLMMERIRSGQIIPPSANNRAVPPELDRIVLKSLAKNPKERYATASDFEEDLRAFAQSHQVAGDATQVAAFVSRMFPAEAAQGRVAAQGESSRMSDKGGSDLDVFDGLAKKSRPSAPVPSSRAPAPPPPAAKKTLLGLAAPPPPPPPSRAPAPPGRPSGPPGARVSRPGSLPPPPGAASRPMPSKPPLPPPSRAPKPPPATAAPVDMDWDDEDEKTAVFDKQGNESPATALLRSAPPAPAAGAPASRMGGAAALAVSSGGAAPAAPIPSAPPMPSGQPHMAPGQHMHPQQVVSAAPPMAAPAPSGGAGRTVMVVLALMLVVALAAAVVLLVLPQKGTLIVTVAGPGNKPVDGVQVLVDGKQRCESSPCRVPELSSGTHMLKVVAAGYQQTADQAVKVGSGEEAVINVKLERASEGTGIRVTAEGSGLKLYVDGKEVGPLPQELKDMTPGEHVIKIAGSERYEPYEKRVNIEADKIETVEPKLKVLKGLATIKAGPNAEGAKVLLVSGGERRPIPKLPIRVDINTDKPWSIIATKKGFADYKQDIAFDDGAAEKTFEIALYEEGKAPPPTPGPIGKAPGPGPGPGPKPTATEKPAPAAGNGTLNINSIPVSNVILDGRPLGTTPKVGISVSAGNHTVVFVHPEHGRKVRGVSVPAGGTATAAVRFP